MVEVDRSSDRVISMTLGMEGILISIVSAYAPQVGSDEEEKEGSRTDLKEVVEKSQGMSRL